MLGISKAQKSIYCTLKKYEENTSVNVVNSKTFLF